MNDKGVISAIEAAWHLRNDVVPLLGRLDLLTLALSFPPALTSVCLARVERPALRLGGAYVDLLAHLTLLCGSQRAKSTLALSPSLTRTLAPCTSLEVDELCRALDSLRSGEDVRVPADAVALLLCGVGATETLRLALSRPRAFAFDRTATLARNNRLLVACARGHVDTVALLLAEEGVPAGEFTRSMVFRAACAGGVGVVESLLRPPMQLAPDRSCCCEGLDAACDSGDAQVVRRLALPPFALGASALTPAMVARACERGQADVLLALAECFAPDRQQARKIRMHTEDAVRVAKSRGFLDCVRILESPPFSPQGRSW
eukprot:m51a1_g3429 hypothetical protein (318) ;mRNA; r:613373-614326